LEGDRRSNKAVHVAPIRENSTGQALSDDSIEGLGGRVVRPAQDVPGGCRCARARPAWTVSSKRSVSMLRVRYPQVRLRGQDLRVASVSGWTLQRRARLSRRPHCSDCAGGLRVAFQFSGAKFYERGHLSRNDRGLFDNVGRVEPADELVAADLGHQGEHHERAKVEFSVSLLSSRLSMVSNSSWDTLRPRR
jgi:hypothetical protein